LHLDWGLLLDVVTAVVALLALVKDLHLSTWFVFVLTVAAPLAAYDGVRRSVRWLREQTRPDFPRGDIFHGLYASQDVAAGSNVFQRTREIEQLEELVLGPGLERRILAVTGTSGAGKSVLVNLLVEELRRSDPSRVKARLERFNSADEALTVLKRLLEEVKRASADLLAGDKGKEGARLVLILDQFEVCLDRIIDTYLADGKTRKSLKEVLAGAQTHTSLLIRVLGEILSLVDRYPGLRIVVVLRSDRYYDLRILGKLGQIPYDAFEVMGISEGPGLDSFEEMLAKLSFAGSDLSRVIDHLRDPDGTILPVKAQLIGCMLEQESFLLRTTWLARLFGKDVQRLPSPRHRWTFERFQREEQGGGLLEKYFRQVIESAPREDIAPDLLFVMGIEGRVKTRYTLEDLALIIFRDEDEILPTLRHLVEGGLVSDARGEYAFSHDYLAQQYNLLSGRLIDPVVRDNLAYSHTTFTEGRKRTPAAAEPGAANRHRAYNVLRAIKFGLLLFFGVRLVRFDWFPLERVHQWVGPAFEPYMTVPQWALDWHYLPIAILQCCWGLYVIDLVGNVFLHADNRPVMRLSSWALIASVLVGMVATALLPGAWLIWLGFDGLLVGSKFWFMGSKIARCTSGRNRYGVIGLYTVINSIFAIYIGAMLYPKIAWDLPQHQGRGALDLLVSFLTFAPALEFLFVYYSVIPLLVYFVYMYRAHVRPSRAVEFIGLYKRVEAVEGRGASL
jgi:hypothetical protein